MRKIFAAAIIIALSFFLDGFTQIFIMRAGFLDTIFTWITNFGSTFVVLIIMTTLFLWEDRKREWIPALWASYITAIIVVFILKILIARDRPGVEEFYPVISMISYSFPSMHAAAAFAAIPILDREYPKLKKFWIIFALLVAFSRLYFNMHYFSDVVAGGFLGYGIGAMFVYLEEKKKIFKVFMKNGN